LADITGMSVPPVQSQTPPTNPTSSANPYNLNPADFIKMMVTQLQNQDPTQPMTNSELLGQISQIGQLQSTDTLQSTLQSMQLQTNLGSGAALLGKSVQGTDANSHNVSGVVNSLQVSGNSVTLNLDSGASLPLANVTVVAPVTANAATTNLP
jgi:flagellar basal-body rod modification protein FlgD